MREMSNVPKGIPIKKIYIKPEDFVRESDRTHGYPKGLGNAKAILVEEKKDRIPEYLKPDSIITHSLKDKVEKSEEEIREIIRNAIDSVAWSNVYNTVYFNALLLSHNWLSKNPLPLFRSVHHSVWKFKAEAGEISLGKTGRVIIDSNEKPYEEEIVLKFSNYDVWDSLLTMYPKSMAIVEDDAVPTRENPLAPKSVTVYENGKVIVKTEGRHYPEKQRMFVNFDELAAEENMEMKEDERYNSIDWKSRKLILFETKIGMDFNSMLDYARMTERQLIWNVTAFQIEHNRGFPLIENISEIKELEKNFPKNTCTVSPQNVDLGDGLNIRITSDMIISSLLNMEDDLERIMIKSKFGRKGWDVILDRIPVIGTKIATPQKPVHRKDFDETNIDCIDTTETDWRFNKEYR